MKHYYQIIGRVILTCCLFTLLFGCRQKDQPKDTVTVTVPQKVLNIINWSKEEAVRELQGIGEDDFLKIEADDSGIVTVVLYPEQMELWQDKFILILEGLETSMKGYDPDYRLVWNEDCSQLDYYAKADMPSQLCADTLLPAEAVCALHQLFSGTAAEDWYVAINIYNAVSGKLVKSGDSNSRLTFDENDWKASE